MIKSFATQRVARLAIGPFDGIVPGTHGAEINTNLATFGTGELGLLTHATPDHRQLYVEKVLHGSRNDSRLNILRKEAR